MLRFCRLFILLIGSRSLIYYSRRRSIYEIHYHYPISRATDAFCNRRGIEKKNTPRSVHSPEVHEDVDEPPVVHAVRAIVAPPLDKLVLPVAPVVVVAHQ